MASVLLEFFSNHLAVEFAQQRNMLRSKRQSSKPMNLNGLYLTSAPVGTFLRVRGTAKEQQQQQQQQKWAQVAHSWAFGVL